MRNFKNIYFDDLIPYLMECCEVDENAIECFVFGEFEYSFRDIYGGEKISVLLLEQVKYRNFFEKRNPNNYFCFFIDLKKKDYFVYIISSIIV